MDLRPEKYYKDPKAKRNASKKDKGLSCRLIKPQMTLFTQGELCGDLYKCGCLPSCIRCTWASFEPLDESERGEWKSWPKAQHQKTMIMASGPITS